MTNPSHRPPFAPQKVFLETAFEQRFQGLLRHAWHNRSWHVIAALPGSGKSLGIQDLVLGSGARKQANVECLIIDDAQDLPLPHLAFLKELTDNLAALP